MTCIWLTSSHFLAMLNFHIWPDDPLDTMLMLLETFLQIDARDFRDCELILDRHETSQPTKQRMEDGQNFSLSEDFPPPEDTHPRLPRVALWELQNKWRHKTRVDTASTRHLYCYPGRPMHCGRLLKSRWRNRSRWLYQTRWPDTPRS